jgi:hypothetical protein
MQNSVCGRQRVRMTNTPCGVRAVAPTNGPHATHPRGEQLSVLCGGAQWSAQATPCGGGSDRQPMIARAGKPGENRERVRALRVAHRTTHYAGRAVAARL